MIVATRRNDKRDLESPIGDPQTLAFRRWISRLGYARRMEDYKRGSHTVWDLKYHLVWTTRYRYQVLGDDVGQRCRELLREIARSKEMKIYAGSVNRDHVHTLIGIPPYLSVSRAVQFLKGKSSHKVLSEFSQLRKR